jgi:hypothetical protein
MEIEPSADTSAAQPEEARAGSSYDEAVADVNDVAEGSGAADSGLAEGGLYRVRGSPACLGVDGRVVRLIGRGTSERGDERWRVKFVNEPTGSTDEEYDAEMMVARLDPLGDSGTEDHVQPPASADATASEFPLPRPPDAPELAVGTSAG